MTRPPIRAATVPLLLIGAVAGACVDLGVNPQTTTVWDTQLAPSLAFPGVAGQAAAVSQLGGTDVGIEIQGGASGAHHVWGLRLGSCA